MQTHAQYEFGHPVNPSPVPPAPRQRNRGFTLVYNRSTPLRNGGFGLRELLRYSAGVVSGIALGAGASAWLAATHGGDERVRAATALSIAASFAMVAGGFLAVRARTRLAGWLATAGVIALSLLSQIELLALAFVIQGGWAIWQIPASVDTTWKRPGIYPVAAGFLFAFALLLLAHASAA